jgi:hypothetical protein
MASPEQWRARVELVLAACSLLLGVFAAATMVAIGYLNYTRFPWFDAWDYWREYLSAGNPMAVLFDRMNEHRIVVTRLLQLADLAWFRADSRLLLWVCYPIQAGSVIVLYRMAAAAFRWRRAEQVYAAGLILTFGFAAGQWINFTWLFLNGFLMIPFAVMSSFLFLKNSVKERGTGRTASMPWVAASIGMALVATGSLSNGVVVWPLLVAMAATLRLPFKAVALIGACGALVVLAYISGDSRPTNANIHEGLRHPGIVAAFALGSLGSAFDEPLMVLGRMLHRDWTAWRIPGAIAAGAIGLAAAASLAAGAVRRRADLDRHRVALLYTLAFFIATSVLIGIGRAKLPLVEALTARYVTFSLLFFACLVVIGISDRARARNGAGRLGVRLAALILAVFVGGFPQLPRVAYAADVERYLAEAEYALINDVYATEAWTRLYYQPGAMIRVVRYFRERRLSLFARDWTTWIGQPVTDHFVIGDQSGCRGSWDSAGAAGGSYTPAVLASGWAFDRRLMKAPDLLVLADASGRIFGYGATTRRRPDVEAVFPETTNQRVGWVAYLPAGLPSDLKAFARLGDERTLCPIGAWHLPGTYITAPAAKAGPLIPGVEVAAQGDWVTETAAETGTSSAWSSRALKAANGQLRMGPVPCGSESTIGLPLTTSPVSSSIRVSIVERGSGKVLAAANPPPGLAAWDLWRLDVPFGAAPVSCDYLIEDNDGDPATWVAARLPRTIAR